VTVHSLWPTNILIKEDCLEFDDEFIKEIIGIGDEYEANDPLNHLPYYKRKAPGYVEYNLINDPRPSCQTYKRILKEHVIELCKAEGFKNPEEIEFDATTTIRKFSNLDYAKPHNHRDSDYVAALWLSMKVTDTGEDLYQKAAGNQLHIMDPVAFRNRLLSNKLRYVIRPKPKMHVIHPAGLIHSSEVNLTNEDTVVLVTNIRILDSFRSHCIL
jgi:hypothetical protein